MSLMEVVLLFYLSVYIRQSKICDTLPTSKMELLVAIGICKAICSRLMILYTQCCLMGFFICVSWLLVPLRRGWFHLQTSEMVLFVKITIAKFVFYWTMVSIAQFLPINLLFLCLFDAESISLQVFPACCRWFQFVAVRSCSFQLSLHFSMYGEKSTLICFRNILHPSIGEGALLFHCVGSSRVVSPWYYLCYLFGNGKLWN